MTKGAIALVILSPIILGFVIFGEGPPPPEWCAKACFGKVGQFSPATPRYTVTCEDGAFFMFDAPESCGARGGVKRRSVSNNYDVCTCRDQAMFTREMN